MKCEQGPLTITSWNLSLDAILTLYWFLLPLHQTVLFLFWLAVNHRCSCLHFLTAADFFSMYRFCQYFFHLWSNWQQSTRHFVAYGRTLTSYKFSALSSILQMPSSTCRIRASSFGRICFGTLLRLSFFWSLWGRNVRFHMGKTKVFVYIRLRTFNGTGQTALLKAGWIEMLFYFRISCFYLRKPGTKIWAVMLCNSLKNSHVSWQGRSFVTKRDLK